MKRILKQPLNSKAVSILSSSKQSEISSGHGKVRCLAIISEVTKSHPKGDDGMKFPTD